MHAPSCSCMHAFISLVKHVHHLGYAWMHAPPWSCIHACTSLVMHACMHLIGHACIHATHWSSMHTWTSLAMHAYMHFIFNACIHELHWQCMHACTSLVMHASMHSLSKLLLLPLWLYTVSSLIDKKEIVSMGLYETWANQIFFGVNSHTLFVSWTILEAQKKCFQ